MPRSAQRKDAGQSKLVGIKKPVAKPKRKQSADTESIDEIYKSFTVLSDAERMAGFAESRRRLMTTCMQMAKASDFALIYLKTQKDASDEETLCEMEEHLKTANEHLRRFRELASGHSELSKSENWTASAKFDDAVFEYLKKCNVATGKLSSLCREARESLNDLDARLEDWERWKRAYAFHLRVNFDPVHCGGATKVAADVASMKASVRKAARTIDPPSTDELARECDALASTWRLERMDREARFVAAHDLTMREESPYVGSEDGLEGLELKVTKTVESGPVREIPWASKTNARWAERSDEEKRTKD